MKSITIFNKMENPYNGPSALLVRKKLNTGLQTGNTCLICRQDGPFGLIKFTQIYPLLCHVGQHNFCYLPRGMLNC